MDSLVTDWDGEGEQKGLALCERVLKNSSPVSSNLEIRSLLFDLLKLSLDGCIEANSVAGFITKLSDIPDLSSELPSLLSDLLAVLDGETSGEGNGERAPFSTLTTALSKYVGEPLLKERLEMETLEQVSLVPSARNFNQKYVKTKTKLFYKQHKFNLFREENEGYSKLVVELGHERRAMTAAPAMLDNIRSLIGRFNLDPNRVLDVILEAYECHPEQDEFFCALLQDYPCERSTFINVLGFKFHQYQSGANNCPTPSSLYKLSALLLHNGLVSLEDLFPHLSQTDSTLTDLHQSCIEDSLTRVKKSNIVSFAEKSEEEIQKEADAEQDKKAHRELMFSLEHNQKLGVCHGLLELGDWDLACALIKMLPPFLAVWSPPITRALCVLVSQAVEPLYRSCSVRAVKHRAVTCEASGIAACVKMEDLPVVVFDMLYHLGPSLHCDPVLMAKLLRLGRIFLKEWASIKSSGELPSQEKTLVYQGFLSLLDEVLLPSLCLLPSNCCLAEETWAMVKQLPYQTRYQLYGRWKNNTFHSHPQLIDAKTETLTKGKFIMKRITVDNIKPTGRQIGKLSHSFPGVIFDYVLSQIQRYDNFISPVVDSLKYLTPLGYDNLAYCIIEALGSPQKERMKYNDTNISQWLKGLSSFCSNVFKKYSIELTGLLQYVGNQLKAGKSVDLLVLKEVIVKMSGIDVTEQVREQQLEAMSGGELLKAEAAYYAPVRNTKKSCQRLREALVDANLSHPLVLLMAQQRDCIVHVDGETRHLKLVGMLFDNCLDTLVQFVEFLSIHTSPEEYKVRLPPLTDLRLTYHIPLDVAFFMIRPVLHSEITSKFSALEKSSNTDKLDKKAKAAQQESNFCAVCHEVLEPVMEAVRELHPAKTWEDINCRLYTTFWVLSISDLRVPVGRYDDEISKATQAIKELDCSDLTSSKKKKEQDRNTVLIEKLQEERQRQEDNHRLVKTWIKREKDNWFNSKVPKNRTITQFLQLCVFPRCRFTALDALYCAQFVSTLHSQQTPSFSTLLFFDRMFSDISYTVSCCTENEAIRYGRFLVALLEIVSRWHMEEAVYNLECAKTPGFISMMRSSGSANEKQDLDFENYRHISFKWHFKLTKSFVILLESKNYIQLRNGLLVLTRMIPFYPKVFHLSIALEKRIEKLMEEEKDKRQDLYTLALGYAGKLKSHKQNLLPEAEFHIKEERMKAQQSDKDESSKGSGKSERPAVGKAPSRPTVAGKTPETKSSAPVSKPAVSKAPPTTATKSTGNKAPAIKAATPIGPQNKPKEDKPVEKNAKSILSKSSEGGNGRSGKVKDDVSPSSAGGKSSRSSSKSDSPAESKNTNGNKAKSRVSLDNNNESKGKVKASVSSGSSPRSGTRRHQTDSPDPSLEKDVKRRKIDEAGSKSEDRPTIRTDGANGASSVERAEKARLDRKRVQEHVSERDLIEHKRRKETAAAVELKEKRRLVKVAKKELTVDLTPTATKKIVADDKPKKHTSVKITAKRK